ncbi:MAG: hypothetical protein KF763_15265 [Cyclobacteriaceae bacterium]|nr:hypothetical protein [Cyclobacteriaceae bacterium]
MARGIYQFNALPESHQYAYVWEHGVFLISRVVEGMAFNLYSCHNFFVEIRYSQPANRIEGLRVFKNISQLEPYLDCIPEIPIH